MILWCCVISTMKCPKIKGRRHTCSWNSFATVCSCLREGESRSWYCRIFILSMKGHLLCDVPFLRVRLWLKTWLPRSPSKRAGADMVTLMIWEFKSSLLTTLRRNLTKYKRSILLLDRIWQKMTDPIAVKCAKRYEHQLSLSETSHSSTT